MRFVLGKPEHDVDTKTSRYEIYKGIKCRKTELTTNNTVYDTLLDSWR